MPARKRQQPDENTEVCKKCGGTYPTQYMSRGYCDGCKWDTWIPRNYEKREMYQYDESFGQVNATMRPRLGVQFLDHSPPRLADVVQWIKAIRNFP